MSSKSASPAGKRKVKSLYFVAYAVIAGLLVWAIVSQFDHFGRGINALGSADLGLVLAGLGLTVFTFFVAAAIYCVLALHRLRYLRTVLIEFASALATRLLPAGIGGLGLHGDYLYRQKHTTAEATAVVSVNNSLGMLASLIVLLAVLVIWPQKLDFSGVDLSAGLAGVVAAVVVAILIVIFSIRRIRVVVARFVRNFGRSLRTYLRQPQKLVAALSLAIIMSLTYAAILLASSEAVGIQLDFAPVFVVFAIGTLVGAATPTPGGLVGVEAGLFAGFSAYGVDAAPALAAVLLYRLLTYWMPYIPGLPAFLVARRARYI